MTTSDADITTYDSIPVAGRLRLTHGLFERLSLADGPFEFVKGGYSFISFYPAAVVDELGSRAHSRPERNGGDTLCILKPNEKFNGEFTPSSHCDVLHLSTSFVDDIVKSELSTSRPLFSPTQSVTMSPVVQSIWRRMGGMIDNPHTAAVSIADFCVELLVLRLVEEQITSAYNSGHAGNLDAVRRAVEYIQANLSEKIDLRSISKAAGLSPFYFSRVFRAAHGSTVHRFVLERRLDFAWRLLRDSDISVSSIALETGFSSQSHLTTSFRQRYGVTPAAFRQFSARGLVSGNLE